MQLTELIDWAFKALLSGVAIYLTSIISQMKSSIEELNKAVAVEIEKSNWIRKSIEGLEKRLDKSDERLFDLEKHK